MHRRFAARLVVPLKGAMCKEYLHALRKHPAPQYADLLTLCDGVGGNERTANVWFPASSAQLSHTMQRQNPAALRS